MKEKIEEFVKARNMVVISQADIVYTAYMNPDVEEDARKRNPLKEEDRQWADKMDAVDGEGLVNLMRKDLPGRVQMLLRDRVIERDEEVYPFVEKRILTTLQERFIDNAVYYILRSEKVTREWILENYDSIRSEDVKSLLCLAIGIKGTLEDAEFLMKETERFEKDCPESNYSRGPLNGLKHLMAKY